MLANSILQQIFDHTMSFGPVWEGPQADVQTPRGKTGAAKHDFTRRGTICPGKRWPFSLCPLGRVWIKMNGI